VREWFTDYQAKTFVVNEAAPADVKRTKAKRKRG
jgi:hypothetical protein